MERLKRAIAGTVATLGSLGVGEVVQAEQSVHVEAQTPDIQSDTASDSHNESSPESQIAFFIILFGAPIAIGVAYKRDLAKIKFPRDMIDNNR